MTDLRAVVIGCGRMGANTSDRVRQQTPPGWIPLSHAEAIATGAGVELAGICDVDKHALRAAGERFGVEARSPDYADLINELRPDIVTIATRTAGRCEIVEFAAGAGVRGIHAEKPLGNNLRDCRRALGAVAEGSAAITYGTVRRFLDAYRLAGEVAHSGEIGEVLQVVVEHGCAPLLWAHPHSADLLLFLSRCDTFEWVQASCQIDARAVDGNVIDADPLVDIAVAKLANGVEGIVSSGPGMNCRILASDGTVTLLADGRSVVVQSKVAGGAYLGPPRKLAVQPEMSATQRAIDELRRFVRAGEAPSITHAEILTGHAMLFGWVLSSLGGGARVARSDIDDGFTVTGRSGELFA